MDGASAGLVAWIDCSKCTGNVGDALSTIPDRKGTYSFSLTGSGAAPTLSVTSGRNSVYSPGGGRYFASNTTAAGSTAAITVAGVFAIAGRTADHQALVASNAYYTGSGCWMFEPTLTTGNAAMETWPGGGYTCTGPNVGTGNSLVILAYTDTGTGTGTWYSNGAATSVVSVAAGQKSLAQLDVANWIQDQGRGFLGTICEVGVWNRALSAAEVANVAGSLAAKWTRPPKRVPPAGPLSISAMRSAFGVAGSSLSSFRGQAQTLAQTGTISIGNARAALRGTTFVDGPYVPTPYNVDAWANSGVSNNQQMSLAFYLTITGNAASWRNIVTVNNDARRSPAVFIDYKNNVYASFATTAAGEEHFYCGTPALGANTHVAIVWNGHNVNAYYDGSASASFTAAGTPLDPPSGANVNICCLESGYLTEGFTVGGLRFFPCAFSATQVLQLYATGATYYNSSALVLALDGANGLSYPGFGSTWTDVSPGALNSLALSNCGYSRAGGGCITFDGASSYGSLATFASFPTSAFTAIVWMSYNGYPAGTYTTTHALDAGTHAGILFTLNRSATTNNELVWQANYMYDYNNGSFGFNWEPTSFVSGPAWVQMVLVKNGTSASWYMNGAPVGTAGSSQNIAYGSSKFYVGVDKKDSNGYFNGSIGMMMIYNYAMTATEISLNFAAFKGRYGL